MCCLSCSKSDHLTLYQIYLISYQWIHISCINSDFQEASSLWHSPWTTSTFILQETECMCFKLGNMQFLIEFLIYSFSMLKTQWQVPKEGVGVKPVLSPPVSGNRIEMPSKGHLPVCSFHTKSLLYFFFMSPCVLPVSLLTHAGAQGSLGCLGKVQHSLILHRTLLGLLGNGF